MRQHSLGDAQAARGAAGLGSRALPVSRRVDVARAAKPPFVELRQLELRIDDAMLGGDLHQQPCARRVGGDAEAAKVRHTEEPEGAPLGRGSGAAQPVDPVGGARGVEDQKSTERQRGGCQPGLGGASQVGETRLALDGAAAAAEHHEADGERRKWATLVSGELQKGAPFAGGDGVIVGRELAADDEQPRGATVGIALAKRPLGVATQLGQIGHRSDDSTVPRVSRHRRTHDVAR